MSYGEAAAIISAIAAIAAAGIGWMARNAVLNVHMDINSRMTELIEATRARAFSEGQVEGRTAQLTERADAAAKVLDKAADKAADVLADAIIPRKDKS